MVLTNITCYVIIINCFIFYLQGNHIDSVLVNEINVTVDNAVCVIQQVTAKVSHNDVIVMSSLDNILIFSESLLSPATNYHHSKKIWS